MHLFGILFFKISLMLVWWMILLSPFALFSKYFEKKNGITITNFLSEKYDFIFTKFIEQRFGKFFSVIIHIITFFIFLFIFIGFIAVVVVIWAKGAGWIWNYATPFLFFER